MLGLLAAVVLGAAQLPEYRPCDIDRLQACRNTNYLVWGPKFERALKAYLGSRRAVEMSNSVRLLEHARGVLGGPPDPPARLSNGNWLFTACKAHECDEKGGVVLEPSGRIVAVGIVSSHCQSSANYRISCDDGPTLDIFTAVPFEASSWRENENLAALDRWAAAAVKADEPGSPYSPRGAYRGAVLHSLRRDKADASRKRASP